MLHSNDRRNIRGRQGGPPAPLCGSMQHRRAPSWWKLRKRAAIAGASSKRKRGPRRTEGQPRSRSSASQCECNEGNGRKSITCSCGHRVLYNRVCCDKLPHYCTYVYLYSEQLLGMKYWDRHLITEGMLVEFFVAGSSLSWILYLTTGKHTTGKRFDNEYFVLKPLEEVFSGKADNKTSDKTKVREKTA